MKYPEEIKAESEVEETLMLALHQSDFGVEFMKKLERNLNNIGTDTDLTQAEKIALTGYIFIEMVDATAMTTAEASERMDADEIRPELLLKALDDALNFDKVVKSKSVDK